MLLKVGSKEVNITELLPLRVADFRRAEKAGVTMQALEEGSYEASFQLYLAVVKRGDPTITEEQLEAVPAHELKDLGMFLKVEQGKFNRPISAEPIASSEPMGGASAS